VVQAQSPGRQSPKAGDMQIVLQLKALGQCIPPPKHGDVVIVIVAMVMPVGACPALQHHAAQLVDTPYRISQ